MSNQQFKSSVPLEGEVGRRFLQLRVGGVVGIWALVSLVLALVHWLFEGAPRGEAAPDLRSSGWAHVYVPLLTLALAGAVRRLALSGKAIVLADAALMVLACSGSALPLLASGEATSADVRGLLISANNLLMARAALVPSTGARTLVIGLLAFAPLVPLTYYIHQDVSEVVASQQTTQAVYWAATAVLVSTLASRIIYGLARKVEEARRLGQYILEDRIGAGGMGEVYRARHALLRRPTAVKLLSKDRTDERDVMRFEREVQLTSQLCHPNTIQIYDFGRSADGTFYYAMEYIDGLTLEQLVLHYGAQSPGRVARILADVCGALSEAHEAGLVHRDIKPQNVMLSARAGLLDVVKVLDFGLVKSLQHGNRGESGSIDKVAGTPAYMSPEAIMEPGRVDARSDLYAVGALGYFLLAGADVFAGDSLFAIFGQHLHATPPPLSQRTTKVVPPILEQLLLACLEKQPEKRPESSRALRLQLLAIADREPVPDLADWWQRRADQQDTLPVATAVTERMVLQTAHTIAPS